MLKFTNLLKTESGAEADITAVFTLHTEIQSFCPQVSQISLLHKPNQIGSYFHVWS